MYDGTTPPKPAESRENREMRPALLRGWRRRCPHCGQGPLMKSYLTVRTSCPVCGEEFHHHRADDGPAYLTILIVGHLLAPARVGKSEHLDFGNIGEHVDDFLDLNRKDFNILTHDDIL